MDQTLVIAKSVAIVGAGPEATDSTAKNQTLRFVGKGTLTVQGVTFRHTGFAVSDIVDVGSGSATLTDCTFRDGIGSKKWTAVGLYVHGTATVEVSSCTSLENNVGLQVVGSARVRVEDGVFKSNNDAGIEVGGKALTLISRSSCPGNPCGIIVYGSARSTLQGNTCTDSTTAGIACGGHGSGTVENNRCTGCDAGILAFQSANPVIMANTSTGNTDGIDVRGHAILRSRTTNAAPTRNAAFGSRTTLAGQRSTTRVTRMATQAWETVRRKLSGRHGQGQLMRQ